MTGDPTFAENPGNLRLKRANGVKRSRDVCIGLKTPSGTFLTTILVLVEGTVRRVLGILIFRLKRLGDTSISFQIFPITFNGYCEYIVVSIRGGNSFPLCKRGCLANHQISDTFKLRAIVSIRF